MLWPFLPGDRKTLLVAAVMLLLLAGFGGRLYVFTVMAQGWEPAIRDFEEQDKTHPPKPGVIVFAGSSSFRFWDTLVSDMKPLDVINRGFGGSQFSDLDQYANRIVVAYRPRAVVVYEGDNDLAAGPQNARNGRERLPKIRENCSPCIAGHLDLHCGH